VSEASLERALAVTDQTFEGPDVDPGEFTINGQNSIMLREQILDHKNITQPVQGDIVGGLSIVAVCVRLHSAWLGNSECTPAWQAFLYVL